MIARRISFFVLLDAVMVLLKLLLLLLLMGTGGGAITGMRPVLVARDKVVDGVTRISIFPSSLHRLPGGELLLAMAGSHDGTLTRGREFASADALSWREVSPPANKSSMGQLFAPAACVPRASDASLLCWPKRLNLVGSTSSGTEGLISAQRWAGAPPAIQGWENVSYHTKPYGQIWYGPMHGKFAVVADGDPPLQLRAKDGSPVEGSWLLSAYAAPPPLGNSTLIAMATTDHGRTWVQRAVIKNMSGVGAAMPTVPGRPCFDHTCTYTPCSSPDESTINRLPDGRIVVLFRNGDGPGTDYNENVPLCAQFSSDEGVSWTEARPVAPPPTPLPPSPTPPVKPCTVSHEFGCLRDIHCATRKNVSTRCIGGVVLGTEGSDSGLGVSKTACACACHQRGFTLAGLEGGNCFCDHGVAPDPNRCGTVAGINASRVCDDDKVHPHEQGGYCAMVVFNFSCPSTAQCAAPLPLPQASLGPKGVEPRSVITPSGRLLVVSGRDGLFAWLTTADKIISGPWQPFNIAAHHNFFYGNETTDTACGLEPLAYPSETVAGTKRMGATTGYMSLIRLGESVVICYDRLLKCKDSTRVYCVKLEGV